MKLLKDLDPKDKKIIIRLDLDVPIENKKVVDGFRIDAALPTLKKLATAEKLYLIGHAGRPDGKVVENLRLKPQAQYLAQVLKLDLQELDDPIFNLRYLLGEQIEILENLRFFAGEENNDSDFVAQIANLGEAFVFEAFAVSHRAHASVAGLSKLLPTYLGLRCQKEMEILDHLRKEEDRTIVLIGGAKIEDKAEIIKSYKAQKILFGGLTAAQAWLHKNDYQAERFVLPIDGVFPDGSIKNYTDLSHDEILKIRDIGPKTIELYENIINDKEHDLIYAGPMGQYEKPEFSRGTKVLFESGIAAKKQTIILGGDSACAAQAFNLQDKISYISVGGGASLTYLVKGKTELAA
jgi:phosphoglycerate kinase